VQKPVILLNVEELCPLSCKKLLKLNYPGGRGTKPKPMNICFDLFSIFVSIFQALSIT
jgi:hypothetical protein